MATLDAQGIANLVALLLQAITAVGPAGVDLYLKLEQLFQLGPDEKENVMNAIKAGLGADAVAVEAVEAWKRASGLAT